ncbi:CAAX amino terminal protease [Corchorus olitorius]|uniref:CAAX amino terminal protease n=1 Tax=Corchorus olitorius TaxID=93759 RepID=A0A1R3KJW6_9ROSI|nr:CAAX amino terminal protease [Corchorus olitorius]
MNLAWPTVNAMPLPTPKFGGLFSKPLDVPTNLFPSSSSFSCKLPSTFLKCNCNQNKITDNSTQVQGFSVLKSDIPWKTGSLWSTMAVYMFNLHIPLGFGGLSIVSYILHQPVLGPQTEDVNNPILKEMLLSSDISKAACVIVYCIITPLLEEMVYRGFLLASLASTMNWQQSVVLSGAIFSAAHFSGKLALMKLPHEELVRFKET